MKFFSGGEKIRNPSDHQGKKERVKKSEQEQVRHFLQKTCVACAKLFLGLLDLLLFEQTINIIDSFAFSPS